MNWCHYISYRGSQKILWQICECLKSLIKCVSHSAVCMYKILMWLKPYEVLPHFLRRIINCLCFVDKIFCCNIFIFIESLLNLWSNLVLRFTVAITSLLSFINTLFFAIRSAMYLVNLSTKFFLFCIEWCNISHTHVCQLSKYRQ